MVALEVGAPHAQPLEPATSNIENHHAVGWMREAALLYLGLLWRPKPQAPNNRALVLLQIDTWLIPIKSNMVAKLCYRVLVGPIDDRVSGIEFHGPANALPDQRRANGVRCIGLFARL